MTLAVVAAYLLVVLGIGLASHRLGRATGEDFFLAGRGMGSFVLLATLFGTHMTAFSILGASGEAYHRGIGVFALMASSSALVVPAVFFFVGTRLWALGKRHGYLTQVEYFRDRWGSETVALTLFVVLVGLLLPYLLIGVKGAGLTLAELTGGAVPAWAGSLGLCLVVLTYVSYGGMRGTAWVNTFQTVVFMTLGAVTMVVLLRRMGGLGEVMGQLAETEPELLVREGRIRPLELLSYTLIPLSAGMFPHLFGHWLTARRASTFRLSIVGYPLCVAVVWLPSVLLGMAGRLTVPGLEGPAANSVLVRMIEAGAPEVLAGLLGAGVFAAIMSSVDSQTLALSNLFTRDVAGRLGRGRFGGRSKEGRRPGETGLGETGLGESGLSEAAQVRAGRFFVAAVLAVTFLLSIVIDRSIFRLGVWSFTGFAALFPLVIAALYWRRSTRQGALASVLTAAAAWIYFLARAWSEPGYTVGGTGLMPVVVITAAAAFALVAVSLLTPAPEPERLARFFGSAPSPSNDEKIEQ